MPGACAVVALLLTAAAQAARLPQPTTLVAAASAAVGEGPTPPRFPGSYTVSMLPCCIGFNLCW